MPRVDSIKDFAVPYVEHRFVAMDFQSEKRWCQIPPGSIEYMQTLESLKLIVGEYRQKSGGASSRDDRQFYRDLLAEAILRAWAPDRPMLIAIEVG